MIRPANMIFTRSMMSCSLKNNGILTKSKSFHHNHNFRQSLGNSFTSTAAVSSKSSSPSSLNKKKDTNSNNVSKSLYFWGTSNNGIIPTKEALESGRAAGGEVKAASMVDGMFNKGTVIDQPTEIDVQDAFGIGKCICL